MNIIETMKKAIDEELEKDGLALYQSVADGAAFPL